MMIKAIDAECKDGMVAAELAFITSAKARGACISVMPAVSVAARDDSLGTVNVAVGASRHMGSAVAHSQVQAR